MDYHKDGSTSSSVTDKCLLAWSEMKILVAENHPLVRKGLQLIIGRRGSNGPLAEANSVEQLFEMLRQTVFDVLVTNLRLSDRSMLELLPKIHRAQPALRVLIFSSFPEHHYAIVALRAGAHGYIEKSASTDEIVDAIERVAAGHTHVSARIAQLIANELSSPGSAAPHDRLSTREREVFYRLARGEATRDIAAALFISAKTVSTHRARILEKTGFRSNGDIVAYAVRASLVP
jgi:two-component system, NarL family, invasion response regulator UvrY